MCPESLLPKSVTLVKTIGVLLFELVLISEKKATNIIYLLVTTVINFDIGSMQNVTEPYVNRFLNLHVYTMKL